MGFTGTDPARTALHGFRVDQRGKGTIERIDSPGAPSTVAATSTTAAGSSALTIPDAGTDPDPSRHATRASSDPPTRSAVLV